MDAVTLIKQHLDVNKLLTKYAFNSIQDDGDFIRCACKLHGGSNPSSFVINKETGLYFCFTNCGGGDAFTLIQKMEECDFQTAVHLAAELFGVDIQNLRITEHRVEYLTTMRSFIKVMKSMRKKDAAPFHINDHVTPVSQWRGFQPDTLRHFNLGYVDAVTLQRRKEGCYTLYKRLVFPLIWKGVQIGLSLRRTRTTDVPKWSHQPANIDTGEILYNYDSIEGSTIAVCEGITDVWAFHEIGVSAVATFGAHLSDSQYRLLMRTGLDIALAYDGDEAGRLATEKAKARFKNKANVRIIRMNDGEDPESIPREELRKRYDSRLQG